jgi:hypothetical protein
MEKPKTQNIVRGDNDDAKQDSVDVCLRVRHDIYDA